MPDARLLILTASPSPHVLPGLLGSETGRAAADDDVTRAVSAALSRPGTPTSVVLGEGDVLLRRGLLDWVSAARAGGARAIAAETTGWLLAKPGVADRLVDAGLTHVLVPLFGAGAAAHDWIVETEGAFARSLRGLKRARAAGLRTRVIAPVLRPSFRTLPDLVRRSLAIGVSGFELRAPVGPDRDAHGLHPHLALAGPHIERAVQLARAAKRGVGVWGVPHCLLGEAAASATDGDVTLDLAAPPPESRPSGPNDAAPTAGFRERIHGSPCASCARTAQCPGPLTSYVSQTGWAGIAPLD